MISVFLLFYLAALVSAQEKNVREINFNVEGRAVISHNDIAGARNEALADALLQAVLSAALRIIPAEIQDTNLDQVRQAVSGQQDKYVKNYKITGEKSQADLYFVNVDANVALSVLMSDLQKIGIIQPAKAAASFTVVSLTVRGLTKYSDFSYLREFLRRKTAIVKNVYPRYFEWQQAKLDIEISTTAQVLADELAKARLYILNTERISNNQIIITLLPGGGK